MKIARSRAVKSTFTVIGIVSALVSFAAPSVADTLPQTSMIAHPKVVLGPEFGVYIPTGSKASNRFGSQWWSVGLGFGNVGQPSTRGTFSPDLSLIARYSSSNHVYMAPVGIQYRIALTTNSGIRPYAGLGADILFADVLSPVDNIHSGIKTRGCASFFLGANVEKNAYVEARYIAASKVDGIDLSGVRLSAGIRF